MKILYIDTSSSYLYSAIIENDKTVVEVKKDYGQQLSEKALVDIANLFTESNIAPKSIDKIIVVNGPGSFTGIRIGITIAKVYAWSLNIPISMITSLEAMAISSDINTFKVPLLDARRGYVYAAIYDSNNNLVFGPKHIKLDSLLEEINKLNIKCAIISNDDIEISLEKVPYSPNIEKIVELKKNIEEISPHLINPCYLKKTEAEEKNNDN